MKERDLSAIRHIVVETPRGEVKYVPDLKLPPQAPIFEADRENPYGHEGRSIFNPEESEGARE